MEKEITIALWGDCVSQEISCKFKHTRALGFVNWLSLISDNSNINQYVADCDLLDVTNYNKRNLVLDLKKESLDYLLEEKANYLIIDPNDCRMSVCKTNHNLFTRSLAGIELCKKLGLNEDTIIYAEEFSIDQYIAAAEYACNRILEVYSPEEIIIHIHRPVNMYSDGNKLSYFNNLNSKTISEKAFEGVNAIYSYLIKRLEGCHVIDFLDNVFGDSEHRFGCFPLHYNSLYYKYGEEALKIIFENSPDEKKLLSLLRDKYSMEFKILQNEIKTNYQLKSLEKRVENLTSSFSLFDNKQLIESLKSTKDINVYFDILNILKDKIGIVIAVKDTPGYDRNNNYRYRLKQLGFMCYPSKLWGMYGGLSFKNVNLLDYCEDTVETPVSYKTNINNHLIELESHSYRKGNRASIKIDGVETAVNYRGMNIVVFDASSFQVIDSIAYDTHNIEAVFYRK